MKKDDETIANSLNIELPPQEEETTPLAKKEGKKAPIVIKGDIGGPAERKSDYKLVRDNLREIIATGQSAVEGILNVADEGESPRAYEVVAQLINTVASANKDLMNLHKQMKDLSKDEEAPKSSSGANVTNNNLFVGSTKDLQKLIKQSNKELDNVVDAEFEVKDDG